MSLRHQLVKYWLFIFEKFIKIEFEDNAPSYAWSWPEIQCYFKVSSLRIAKRIIHVCGYIYALVVSIDEMTEKPAANYQRDTTIPVTVILPGRWNYLSLRYKLSSPSDLSWCEWPTSAGNRWQWIHITLYCNYRSPLLNYLFDIPFRYADKVCNVSNHVLMWGPLLVIIIFKFLYLCLKRFVWTLRAYDWKLH